MKRMVLMFGLLVLLAGVAWAGNRRLTTDREVYTIRQSDVSSDAWELDTADAADTSDIYLIKPGATIYSAFVITNPNGDDSVDTYIVLETAINVQMPNGASAWVRSDSILYASQDTVVFKDWGPLSKTRVRFILNPVLAGAFADTLSATFYGIMAVDK